MSSKTSSPCSSPSHSMLGTSLPPASTAASSPPPDDLDAVKEEEEELEDALIDMKKCAIIPSQIGVVPLTSFQDMDVRFKRLTFVLEKSAMYSKLLTQEMDKANEALYNQSAPIPKKPKPQKKPPARRSKRRKQQSVESESEEEEAEEALATKRRKLDDGEDNSSNRTLIFQQPSLITGATLRPYQLDGLRWMASLHSSGISGILADEMGLGKTLQIIAFSAHLRELGAAMPFLIVCPLSVLHNWMDEYAKFAPSIPVCMYHGTPAERASLRREVMRVDLLPVKTNKKDDKSEESESSPKPVRGRGRGRGRGRRGRGPRQPASTKQTLEVEEVEEVATPEETERALKFPVVVTTYEMIIKDRVHLAAYEWGYIVVDEGHRLKNLDCTLTREIKKYSTASRMILTGTPLHNNLAELWSLLNFILPDIFNDVDAFQSWFNLPSMQASIGNDRTARIVESLHAILKPFLLRRLKSDVETNLPPKKEYVLYAPLSVIQRETYDKVLDGTLRAYLMQNKEGTKETFESVPEDLGPRKLRNRANKERPCYLVEEEDDVYFNKLESAEEEQRQAESTVDLVRLREAHHKESARKKVNNMKLQNTVMQLRKVCSHPFLFDWPLDPTTLQPILNDELVSASGKMMVLDRLLTELFKRKHKVLLFSQFTTMLNILEDWAREIKGWVICRIDGSSSPTERREQMLAFQNGGDAPGAPHLFLLSTRAGGLGINLVAADTVIFYDQDWNPQMDAQAQDRAHRIGQTKPVLIYRLVSAHTIETKIMQRATEKRQLEALVIAKGKFRMPGTAAQSRGKSETIAEMAASLMRLEGEKIEVVPNTNEGKANVLSDADLESLLDRSPEVFTERGKGWTSADAPGAAATEGGKKAAFAVYETTAGEGNDALAMMLGEDDDD
ncbi:SNF2 family DNA-dependent ATPase [Lentinula raphanica]|nr:SNF2 family DNA-dependent ATPase [Lentinula raphanica]